MPKITIVIIVYNTEAYLPQCLDSVIGQSLKDIEIIVVNDCSPGNCREIVQEYQKSDARIKYIEHEKNGGCVAARVSGSKASAGEYIQHLDSDDWLDLDTCETIYNALQASRADACFYGYKKICDGTIAETISYQDCIYNQDEFTKAYLEYDIVKSPTKGCNYGVVCYIIKNEVFQRILRRLPKDLPHAVLMEDFFLTSFYFLEIENLVSISHAGYNYRHTVGVSMRKNDDPIKPAIGVISILIFTHKMWKEQLKLYALYQVIYEDRLYRHWKAWNGSILCYDTHGVYNILQVLYELEKTHLQEDIRAFIEAMWIAETRDWNFHYKATGIKASLKELFYALRSLMFSLLNKFLKIIGIGKKF